MMLLPFLREESINGIFTNGPCGKRGTLNALKRPVVARVIVLPFRSGAGSPRDDPSTDGGDLC
ncbi:MAG TPA: hypothetical protein PK648_15910, partial [Verrucomicrobiales bacterium]|nr:hypothetical protein [Verrucomicrobiales bacterium]